MLNDQKFWVSKIFLNDSESLLCSPRMHLLDKKYSNTVKYYYNLKKMFSIWMYFKA